MWSKVQPLSVGIKGFKFCWLWERLSPVPEQRVHWQKAALIGVAFLEPYLCRQPFTANNFSVYRWHTILWSNPQLVSKHGIVVVDRLRCCFCRLSLRHLIWSAMASQLLMQSMASLLCRLAVGRSLSSVQMVIGVLTKKLLLIEFKFRTQFEDRWAPKSH